MFQENGNSSLEEKVYKTLEDQILSQKLTAGEAVTELKLSAELGVSRTPVREALQRLDREGLIKLIPNKGAFVIGISEKDLIDIYMIRMRLEGLAARITAEKADESTVRHLRENTELTEFFISKGNVERVKDLDSDFHDIIYRACESRMLCKTLSELRRIEKSFEEHKQICDAIEKKDMENADRLMSRHVEHALDNLLSIIQK